MRKVAWKGITDESLEHLELTNSKDVIKAHSNINGSTEGKIYSVNYDIEVDHNWSVQYFAIEYQIDSIRSNIKGAKIENNKWEIIKDNTAYRWSFDFIDISVTPFTNTLPIRNLNLKTGEEKIIDVLYIDIVENDMKVLNQKYHRITDRVFRFENVPNDFEAEIEVDEFGLVTYYPSLFIRVY